MFYIEHNPNFFYFFKNNKFSQWHRIFNRLVCLFDFLLVQFSFLFHILLIFFFFFNLGFFRNPFLLKFLHLGLHLFFFFRHLFLYWCLNTNLFQNLSAILTFCLQIQAFIFSNYWCSVPNIGHHFLNCHRLRRFTFDGDRFRWNCFVYSSSIWLWILNNKRRFFYLVKFLDICKCWLFFIFRCLNVVLLFVNFVEFF